MNLLRNPPHTVIVQRMRKEVDERGTTREVPDGAPVSVPCSVQSAREWSTAEETRANGLQVLDIVRVFAKSWPGDQRSIVYWDGGEWETVGSPQNFTMSPRTQHWAVTLRWRGAA